jgi:hypothetical protein
MSVHELPLNDAEIEKIVTAPNEIVAELWRQVLRDEGIIALVKPTGLGHAYVANSLNPHHVYTRTDQAERAREVIAAFSDGSSEDADGESSS